MATRSNKPDTLKAAKQEQFLDVISRDEAMARFLQAVRVEPLGTESIVLRDALGRVLADDVRSDVDVPGFDRSNVDGFAIQAADSFTAMEESPREVKLNSEVLSPGIEPRVPVDSGTATTIATGAMLPRGADAVVMVEDTDVVQRDDETLVEITRSASPGQNISFAGTDIARGETVLRAGQILSSREIGVLAAIGRADVDVYRRPRVAIISTGDEIVAPGGPRPPGTVYDSNLSILTATVLELGGEPVPLGVVRDDEEELRQRLVEGLKCDAVILSGGTSKGAGDLSYRVVSRLDKPGIVAHGVALKPGKPICLAATEGKPVVILPGFPTSAIFTFHEFVAPVIHSMAGLPQQKRETLAASLPLRVNSERGRTEYLLVNLVRGSEGLAAYPMGKGSGSVTTFSGADGYITIPAQTEIVDAGSTVEVHLLSQKLEPADLVCIGSHCVGLDLLLGEMQRQGFATKALHVGSMGGLSAAKRGECDIAGIHLMDPTTGEYNRSFLTEGLELIHGYGRMQSILFRPGDIWFAGKNVEAAIEAALADPGCTMINRNAGSGTRILVDKLLGGKQPPGYAVQPKSHNAVAAAIAQGRADWGLAIDTMASSYGLASIPVQEERYDFVIPRDRTDRPAVKAFRQVLSDPAVRAKLVALGFQE